MTDDLERYGRWVTARHRPVDPLAIRAAANRAKDGLGSDLDEVPTSEGSGAPRRWLLVAAAVLVVALLATGLLLTRGDGEDGQLVDVVGPPPTLLPPPDADPLVQCSNSGPFRLSALDGPTGAEAADDPPAAALRDAFGVSELDLPNSGWRRLSTSDDVVVFGHGDPPEMGIVSVRNTADGWGVAGGSAGGCRPQVLVDGVDPVEWNLDPAHPADPEATTLHLLVTLYTCDDGPSPETGIVGPEVREQSDAVVIAVAHERIDTPDEPTVSGCSDPSTVAMDVDLSEPVGSRQVLDGMFAPPAPPVGTAQAVSSSTTSTTRPSLVLGDGGSEVVVKTETNRAAPCPTSLPRPCLPTDPVQAPVHISTDSASVDRSTGADGTLSLRVPPGPLTLSAEADGIWCPTSTIDVGPTSANLAVIGCTRLDDPHGEVSIVVDGDASHTVTMRFSRQDEPNRYVNVDVTGDATTAVLEPGTWIVAAPDCSADRTPIHVTDASTATIEVSCP